MSIKNFDIPESCRDCDFARGEYLDTSWEKGYCGLGEGAFNKHSDTQRLKSCPLMENRSLTNVLHPQMA